MLIYKKESYLNGWCIVTNGSFVSTIQVMLWQDLGRPRLGWHVPSSEWIHQIDHHFFFFFFVCVCGGGGGGGGGGLWNSSASF